MSWGFVDLRDLLVYAYRAPSVSQSGVVGGTGTVESCHSVQGRSACAREVGGRSHVVAGSNVPNFTSDRTGTDVGCEQVERMVRDTGVGVNAAVVGSCVHVAR